LIQKQGASDKPVLVIGVSGSSSCYKICSLIRTFRSRVDLHVVMTAAAMEFIRPRLFRVLTGNPVLTGLFDEANFSEHPHVWLARRATVFLIAPATAGTISKIASGATNDALSTLALSISPRLTPCFVAPAMAPPMLEHPAVAGNLRMIESMGYHIIPPRRGVLADGLKGAGKLAEADEIANTIRNSLWASDDSALRESKGLDPDIAEALELFHRAVRMHDEGALAPENRIGQLELDHYLHGRLGQVSSRVIREILGNIEALVAESHKVHLEFFDSRGHLTDGLEPLQTVRTFVVYLASKLQSL
jgi:phosphopantothenoylcysteine decarboxylase